MAPASGVEWIFAGSREGEIEPCGCQVHQIGGLHRLQNYLEKQKTEQKGPPTARFFVDAGDSFFSLPQLPPSRNTREKIRAKLIATAYKQFGVQLMGVGVRDLALGLETTKEIAKEGGISLLSSNISSKDGSFPFPRILVEKSQGIAVAFLALADPSAALGDDSLTILPPETVLPSLISSAKKQADFVVILSQLSQEENEGIAKKFPVDLMILAHAFDWLQGPKKVGTTWLVQTKNQGQQIGYVYWDSKKAKEPVIRVDDLAEDLDSENSIKKLMNEYKEKMRKMAVEEAEGAMHLPASKEPYVASASYCKNCHPAQYDFWEKTKHASAYLVLYAKNQHFDPDCIGCHSLGFGDSRGFSTIAKPLQLTSEEKPGKTPFIEQMMKTVFEKDPGSGPLDSRTDPKRYAVLKKAYHEAIHKKEESIERLYVGVQCEHCHGNRNGHPSPEVKTQKKVVEASCKSCHTPPHAQPYDPQKFALVACPLSSKL